MRRLLLSSMAASALFVAAPASAQDLQAPPPIQQGGPNAPPVVSNEQLGKQETTRKLNEAESEDSGRNFELIWADAQAGVSFIDMAGFSSDDFKVRQTKSAGPSFGLGAGVRFLILYAGVRARYDVLSMFNLWRLNAEVGIKVPIFALDFMTGLHGGYAFVGSLSDTNRAVTGGTTTPASNDAVAIRGFNAGVDVAVDYYVNSYFSVGLGAVGDVLFLNRPSVDLPKGLTAEQQAAAKSDPVYSKSGSSVGLGLGGMLRLGLHLGL